MWNWIKKLFGYTPKVIDAGAKAVEVLAPVAQAVAPLTGSNAAAVAVGAAVAGKMAKAVDDAIPDEQQE